MKRVNGLVASQAGGSVLLLGSSHCLIASGRLGVTAEPFLHTDLDRLRQVWYKGAVLTKSQLWSKRNAAL